MTVTREPADRPQPGVTGDAVDDAELAALEAAAAQARGDARRAARAVRLARGARGRTAIPAVGDPAVGDPAAAPAPVSLTKAPAAPVVGDEVVGGQVDGQEDQDAAEDAVVAEDAADTDTDTDTDTAPAPDAATVVKDIEDTDDTDTDDTDAEADADTADTDAEADADTADTADTADPDPDRAGRIRRRPRRVTVLAAVGVLLAAVFVVIAAVVRAQAGDTAGTSPAAARDAALLAARQDIIVLNTLDYTDVDGGLQRWLGATTGTLHDQLEQVSDSDKQAIAASKSVTTASVLAAAVTQVDAGRGNATVIASVQIDVKPQSGTASTKRTRFSLTMTKVGTAWKIGAVQQVPVTLT